MNIDYRIMSFTINTICLVNKCNDEFNEYIYIYIINRYVLLLCWLYIYKLK